MYSILLGQATSENGEARLKIIGKYLFKEVAQTWVAVTGVLLLILISNQFARVLGDAAAGKLPRDAVLSLLGLTSLNYLTILVPLGLFLSVMLALGRLYKDSEVTAMTACGVGPLAFFRPVILVAAVLTVALAWLSLAVSPWALRQIHEIKEVARQEAQIGNLEAGRFQSSGSKGIVFYAEGLTADGRLRNVFMERKQGNRVEAIVAQRAEQKVDSVRDLRMMVLYDGRRYEGIPGASDFRIVDFAEHGIPIAFSNKRSAHDNVEARPTLMLLRSSAIDEQAEMQWRIAAPISAMLLAMLAVPLARTNPRQGRYGKLVVAILLYIVYSNLLGSARVWIEQGALPALVGTWWVHALIAGLAIFLFMRQYGRGKAVPAKAAYKGSRTQ